MTDSKKPLFSLEFTHAALRELEKLDPGVRREIFFDIEKLKGLKDDLRPFIRFGTKSSSSWW